MPRINLTFLLSSYLFASAIFWLYRLSGSLPPFDVFEKAFISFKGFSKLFLKIFLICFIMLLHLICQSLCFFWGLFFGSFSLAICVEFRGKAGCSLRCIEVALGDLFPA